MQKHIKNIPLEDRFTTFGLLEVVNLVANQRYDGHFTIMSFTSEYKACFGTPEPFRDEVEKLPGFSTIHEALADMLSKEFNAKIPDVHTQHDILARF